MELYTETYARAHGTAEHAAVLQRFADTAHAAHAAGLGVNAGHDLNLRNLADFLRAVPGVAEVSIGHALIADALELGYAQTVQAYRHEIAQGQPSRAMIVGIGTDLCDIRRVQETLNRRGDRFAQKVLGDQEYAVYTQRGARLPLRGLRYLATRFSAKEAFSKAVGLGIRTPMTWRGCEILNAPSGKPLIVLNGALAQWFDSRDWMAHVTVTDEGDYASAFVVVETKLLHAG